MSKDVMAECLEEARKLWEAFSGEAMIEKEEDGTTWWSWTQEIATLACTLYQERMRRQQPLPLEPAIYMGQKAD